MTGINQRKICEEKTELNKGNFMKEKLTWNNQGAM